jgi:hypothetical protein
MSFLGEPFIGKIIMDVETKIRGYDDSALLKVMADGLVAREYASVEEAAKAVLSEDSGSNVDRLRRKFREQGWYERGLNDYVETQIAERGLMKVNMGAKLCIFIEDAFRNPKPVFERLFHILGVLLFRTFDVDGRRISGKERLGGFLRVVSVAAMPFIILDALVYLIRLQEHLVGLELLKLACSMLALGFGMFWNRVPMSSDMKGLVEADRQWVETCKAQRRKCAAEYDEGRRVLVERYLAGMGKVK